MCKLVYFIDYHVVRTITCAACFLVFCITLSIESVYKNKTWWITDKLKSFKTVYIELMSIVRNHSEMLRLF